jgi:hypothetical protein
MSLRHALTVCYDIKTPKATPLLQLLLEQLTAAAAAAGGGSIKEQQQQQQSPLRPSIDLQVDATGGKFVATAAAAAADGSKIAAAATAAASPAAAIAAMQALLAADAAAVEQYLAPRHVIDVLQEYSAAKLTPQQVGGVCVCVWGGGVRGRRRGRGRCVFAIVCWCEWLVGLKACQAGLPKLKVCATQPKL